MDYWGWFNCLMGATIGSTLIWRGMGKTSPLSFKLLAIYCTISMLSVVAAPEVRYPEAKVILATFSAQAFFVFLCGIAVFKWKPRIPWKVIVACLVAIELLRLVYTWDVDSGFLLASSFSSSFLAATITLIPIWLMPLSGAAIFILGGTTAKMVLAVQLLAHLWVNRYFLAASILSLGYTALGVEFALTFLSSPWSFPRLAGMASRLEHWQMLWNFWSDRWSTVVFGTGFGTLEWLGFLIQRAMFHMWHPPKLFGANLSALSSGEMFQRMHNDWYQTLFELGLVGFVLMAVVYFKLLKQAWKTKKKLFPVWVGVGVWGLTYYPLHSPITVIFVALLAHQIWESRYYGTSIRS